MSTSRAAGFTIIEVLVAMLVLSFGVMGSAAMQLVALRTRHQSSLLSNAVHLGSSMLDGMRANASQMALGDLDNPYLGLDYDAATPAASGSACLGADLDCDSAQMADFDIAQWKRQLGAGVPGGRFVICRDDQAGSGAGGMAWHCSGNPAAPIVIKLGWTAKNLDGSVTSAPQAMLVLTLTGGST
jgi:type IV pilus assembly protein PilV